MSAQFSGHVDSTISQAIENMNAMKIWIRIANKKKKEENQSVIDDQSNDVGGETEYETESDADCDERNEEKSVNC
jgi:hypothetical protein